MDVFFHPESCKKLINVKLPDPKTNQLKTFLYDEEKLKLFELTKYTDDYRSWFCDDLLVKDGNFFMITRIDPLFIFLPALIKYKTIFKSLDDICMSESENLQDKLNLALNPEIDWNLVCESKEINNELYIRYNEDKTLDWLVSKSHRVVDALKKIFPSSTSKSTLISYAYDLIADYIPVNLVEKFKSKIRDNMKIDVDLCQSKISLTRAETSSSVKRASSDQDNSFTINKKQDKRKATTNPVKTGPLFKYFAKKK